MKVQGSKSRFGVLHAGGDEVNEKVVCDLEFALELEVGREMV
jgi:hypothetical protein